MTEKPSILTKVLDNDGVDSEYHFKVIGCVSQQYWKEPQRQIDMLKYCEITLDSTFVMWYKECLKLKQ